MFATPRPPTRNVHQFGPKCSPVQPNHKDTIERTAISPLCVKAYLNHMNSCHNALNSQTFTQSKNVHQSDKNVLQSALRPQPHNGTRSSCGTVSNHLPSSMNDLSRESPTNSKSNCSPVRPTRWTNATATQLGRYECSYLSIYLSF